MRTRQKRTAPAGGKKRGLVILGLTANCQTVESLITRGRETLTKNRSKAKKIPGVKQEKGSEAKECRTWGLRHTSHAQED